MTVGARPGGGPARGFTLIEVTIVVMMIAVLSILGVSIYRGMLEKARMTQAKIVLTHLAKAELIYYSNWDVYTDNVDKLDFNPVRYRFYQVTVALDNGMKNYTGTATGIGIMAGDRWFVTRDLSPYQDNTSPFFR